MRVCATPPFSAEAIDPADTSRAESARWRAHDLLRVLRLPRTHEEPEWVRAAFARAPWAVVRRARGADGFVAVGVRGAERDQRFGTWLHHQDIESFCSPEELIHRQPQAGRSTLPPFVALALLRDMPSALRDVTWGPTGSTGFELATGLPTLSATSDLDLLIRLPERCEPALIHALANTLAHAATRANTRVDAQVETPAGGVALAELAAEKPRVLVRANDGPRFLADPWQPS
ncbi:malonate decarboxylase holo-ACP synthase [Paraburkholderia sp. J12]|uniref:malonate decarboxylase holo-ACP synthase n=1 Tax=Paraburkholderia sp. J12 TaxID=2805432 RepID=UPI002ABDC9D0|nr:malonate decarboxylase holo-ACP synthase [Paraburkholderia sp. J12]